MIKPNYLLLGGEIFRRSIFSVNAAVQINKEDPAGLERLIYYCARPIIASERLTWLRDKAGHFALPLTH